MTMTTKCWRQRMRRCKFHEHKLLFDGEKRICIADGTMSCLWRKLPHSPVSKFAGVVIIVDLYPRINFHQNSPTGLLPTRCDFADVACTCCRSIPPILRNVTSDTTQGWKETSQVLKCLAFGTFMEPGLRTYGGGGGFIRSTRSTKNGPMDNSAVRYTCSTSIESRCVTSWNYRCKNVFTFFIPVTFTFLNVFYFLSTFFYFFFKKWIENSIKKFEKHFWSHCNEWLGADRALRTQHITFGSAYSDTAAMTSCSRQSREVVNCNKLNSYLCL